MTKVKRVFLLIVALFLLVTLLVSCAPKIPSTTDQSAPDTNDTKDSTDTTVSSKKPFEGKTVRFLSINHNWTNAAKTLFDKFTAETGIMIDIEGMTQAQLAEKIAIESAAKSKNLDVFMYRPQAQRALYEKNGWLLSLEDFIAKSPEFKIDDFYQAAIDVVKSNGKISAIPLTTEKIVMYYRKDLFEAKGVKVPTTLEELKDAAAKLTDKDAGIYGIVMRGKRGEAITVFSSFLQSLGGTFGPVDGKATFNTPEALEAYDLYGTLLREYGPPGILNMSVVECSSFFAEGYAAIYIDSDNERMSVLNPEKSVIVDTVGFAPFPGGKPWNACFWALGISPFSAQPEVAWEFIKFIMGPESAYEIHKIGSPSARKTPWEDKDIIASWPEGWEDVMKKTSEVGVGSVLPNVINIEKARDLTDGVLTVSIEGGDFRAEAVKANEEYQKIIDEEK